MSQQQYPFSNQYLDRKHTQLLRLRNQLRANADTAQTEQAALEADSASHVNDMEDVAQRLDQLDKDGSLIQYHMARLARVERALQKIADGSYGLSDVSGERIPVERLEAMPEATTTLAEQEASER